MSRVCRCTLPIKFKQTERKRDKMWLVHETRTAFNVRRRTRRDDEVLMITQLHCRYYTRMAHTQPAKWRLCLSVSMSTRMLYIFSLEQCSLSFVFRAFRTETYDLENSFSYLPYSIFICFMFYFVSFLSIRRFGFGVDKRHKHTQTHRDSEKREIKFQFMWRNPVVAVQWCVAYELAHTHIM